MPCASGGGIAGVIGPKLYVAGGLTGLMTEDLERLICLQIYDIALNTWELGPDMPEHLLEASAAVIWGKLYIAGISKATKRCVCVYFTPESMEWKYTAPIGPVVDSLFNPSCYLVKHNKSLWVFYTHVRDQKNYWQELQDNGEWSKVSSAVIPQIPNHIVRSVRAIVSTAFKS